MWPGPRPTCTPILILIHPTVWPQYTNDQRYRQTDRQTGQRSDRIGRAVFGRPFVKRFALCYRSVVCLSCLPVLSLTLVHCGQTVGWIKMKLGMQVGLGHEHTALDGDPAPPPLKGHSPQFSAHILWPNGWMDQDGTRHGARPQPRRLC